MAKTTGLRALVLTLVACAFLFGASEAATKTTAAVGNLPCGEGCTGKEVPAFATVAALDTYYNAADSGCVNDCLASTWLRLARQGNVAMLDVGMTVWILRIQKDPANPNYHICRIVYYPHGGGVNAWVLCSTLESGPFF